MDKFCITEKSFGLPKRNHLMFHKYLSSKRQGLQVRWLCPPISIRLFQIDC